jgi:type II secretory pathway component GspD/PulD (secretin)
VIVEYKENVGSEFGISAGKRTNLMDEAYFMHPTPDFAKQKGTDVTELGTSGRAVRQFLMNSLGLGATNTLIDRIPEDYFLFIRFLESQDKAKVLAQPSIVTLNGNKASINVDETQYFAINGPAYLTNNEPVVAKVQPITFGIKLDITPWISKGGQITAEIAPVVSNSDGKTGDYPNISQRAITTTVRLEDGQTIMLGGLVKNQETDALRKIPFFGDIPFIGVLFRNTVKVRTKSNLVVYITPHILTRGYSVDLKQELKNLEKTNKDFMERKIEDTINKQSYRNYPDTAAAGTAAPGPTGPGKKQQAQPQSSDPVQHDSVIAPR